MVPIRWLWTGLAITMALYRCGPTEAGLQVFLPQRRAAYQTNETIDIAVMREAPQALVANTLTLTLIGTDDSKWAFRFAVPGVAGVAQPGLGAQTARRTEILHLNGWCLRPGSYSIQVEVDKQSASTNLEIFNHVRRSDYKLINWGRATGKQQLPMGEENLGFNLFYGGYAIDEEANFIRAGVDFMANCVMSGGHQMDIRMECDWSDPLVTKGGTMRVTRRAFMDRMRGNVPGVHFYDEPGLTWHKHPTTGAMTPHDVPGQVRSYRAAFDREPLSYYQIDPQNPEHVARWRQWARWKLSFMDAAWKEAQFGVSSVRPDFLSVTQSQYGFSAFTDGYYFNVARCLPVTSGHGGYHDYGPGYFNPSYHLEMARARDYTKPCWYLPTWYGNTTSDQYRLEQYLSFQTNIQGMMSPPDIDPYEPEKKPAAQGVVETNQLMQRLGPIFQVMPVTKPPVALLFSLSQAIHTQTQDREANYIHAMPHGLNLPLVYLAGKLIQNPMVTVVEEDILDGTLVNDHRAIVLTSLDYLAPEIVTRLEEFAASGGRVLLTGDSTVKIAGATRLSTKPAMPDQAIIDQLMKEKKYNELGPYQTTGKFITGALPLAKELSLELSKAGIAPVMTTDVSTIVATRQAQGDVEYLFAVNATYDDAAKGEKNALKPVTARLGLPNDGRPVYDAILGGAAPFIADAGGKLTGNFRFGPGQMRVYARTARPIGSVKALTPMARVEPVVETQPARIEFSAVVHDIHQQVLQGAIPLHVRLVDPLGGTRHEVFRATKQGVLPLTLPLAVNDPPGLWTVWVRELLNNTTDTKTFIYRPTSLRAAAGATARALCLPDDRQHIFRFGRLFHEVTIVRGKSSFNEAASQRLKHILEPWGIYCKEMDLPQASKARVLSAEEAKTWVGLNYAGSGQIKAGGDNPPQWAGFAVRGPVILLGNPQDHPIIQYLHKERFLPYEPDATTLPGAGRGMVAWQRDGIGRGQESITLIAYDAAGVNEAVGTFYEALAGLEPLTRWELPIDDRLTPTSKAPEQVTAPRVVWEARLPDRVTGLAKTREGLVALTHDGSRTVLDGNGRPAGVAYLESAAYADAVKSMQPAPALVAAAQQRLGAKRLVKFALPHQGGMVVACWGGLLECHQADGKTMRRILLPQDPTALTTDGERILVGLADGRVVALAP